jgi:hypothetical protein
MIIATSIDFCTVVVYFSFSLAAAPQGVPHGSILLPARVLRVATDYQMDRLLSLVLIDSRCV